VHVQVPFDGALVQSVLQTAGPVLVVVKAGISQQQDLEYAIEQLTWLGVVDHVAGVVSVSGASRPAPSAPPMTARQLAKAKADQAAAAATLEDVPVEANGSADSGQDSTLTPRGAGRGGS
jgi:hypothetical protein